MSLVIVPLAGPDFHTPRFGIRPLHPVGGSTLIEHVLGRRPWLSAPGAGLVFVLREEGGHTAEARAFLARRFPRARFVTLGDLSAGAPLSALAGVALASDPLAPVIVDLADIGFEADGWDPAAYFRTHPEVDALLPWFTSSDPKFSYLRLDGVRVLEAREKQVISSHASAGVYAFRDVATCLRAVGYGLQHPEVCRVGPAWFVCPSVNGLITPDRQVHALEVRDVEPVSALFHGPA
jgi:hypothetical protein